MAKTSARSKKPEPPSRLGRTNATIVKRRKFVVVLHVWPAAYTCLVFERLAGQTVTTKLPNGNEHMFVWTAGAASVPGAPATSAEISPETTDLAFSTFATVQLPRMREVANSLAQECGDALRCAVTCVSCETS